jgi:hypothetical protein
MTLLSMGMLIKRLEPRKRDAWMLPAVGMSMFVEVSMITLQQWRGVPSHFNHATLFDSMVDWTISGLIVFIALALTDLAIRTFTSHQFAKDYQIAWRSGMAYLILSCLIGAFILAYGMVRVRAGLEPTTYGKAGVVKFPHGVAIHAIQLLPAVCWWLTRIGVSLPQRIVVLRGLNLSVGLLLAYSLVQTLQGRSRSDLSLPSFLLILLAIICLLPLVAVHLAIAKDQLHALWGRRATRTS